MSVPLVSVVLPIYGSHRRAQTLACVSQAWLAQDVPCEVVIASAGDVAAPALHGAVPSGVRVVTASPMTRSPGTLRNVAASAARGHMLYLSDADIVPLGRDFLGRALELAGCGAVVQPWLYRLIKADNVHAPTAWQPPGEDCFCLVTADESDRLVPVPGERVIWEEHGIPLVEPPSFAIDPDDNPTLIRRHAFHFGGALVDRQLFETVGGYCEQYVGWGSEDGDLVAKLAHRTHVVQAWRENRSLACLHFEHPRPHSSQEFFANRALFRRRLAAGGEAMIRQDLEDLAIRLGG